MKINTLRTEQLNVWEHAQEDLSLTLTPAIALLFVLMDGMDRLMFVWRVVK